MFRKQAVFFLLPMLPLTLLALACAQDPTPPEQEEILVPLTEQEASEIVYDVIVDRQEDGTFMTRAVPITRGARRVQELARLHREEMPAGDLGQVSSALERDSACDYMSFWAYSQPSQQGNRLCLHEPSYYSGQANLSQFPYYACLGCPLGSWSQKMQSYWSGYKAGTLSTYPAGQGSGGGPGFPTFAPYQRMDKMNISPVSIELRCPSGYPATCPG